MQNIGMLRRGAIDSLTAQHVQQSANATVVLWEPLATEIIAIVGVNGFESLYARSVSLTQSTFPWLAADLTPPATDHRFEGLQASLAATTPELAQAANRLLLTIFTDTLASLIGEPLTTRILDSAWGIGASNHFGKDSNND